MYDVLGVEILQGLAHLSDEVRSSWLCVTAIWLLFQILVELSPRGILQYKVNFLLVPEEAVHPENVVMAQVRLDLDLPPELVLDI